jgi:hypothetical protein
MPRCSTVTRDDLRKPLLKGGAVRSALCQAHTEAMVAVLVEIAQAKKATWTARAVAAQAVLDRGCGKPMQAHEFSGSDGKPLQVAPVIIMTGKPKPDDPEES